MGRSVMVYSLLPLVNVFAGDAVHEQRLLIFLGYRYETHGVGLLRSSR